MPRHLNSACMATPRCMYPPGPSHPSCWWKACPDNTKRAHPQASQTNILPSQITASASLTSSAGSVMGQLSIGRLADLSWILRLRANHWNTDPKCNCWQERPMLRACGNIHSCSVRSNSSAAAHSPNYSTNASATPSPSSPSCSPVQPMRPATAPCSGRRNQSVPSTHPSRGAATGATPASSLPPSSSCSSTPAMSSQSWCSLTIIAALVESTTTDSALPRTPVTFLTMPRLAMCGWVNRLQTPPLANGGTVNGPSSDCTSRQSACGWRAAGATSFSTMVPCAEDTTSSSQWQL
ncbi:hypothetical protein TCDM_12466 [Trypanosoma cruzi Dm28c]|uniref:Uncharacterized protein n=1 Tax=Trypanosoma cruzi Dm28c TaxID=1416333 RepID=V5ATB6_TRYCR|nr:hypothetical protein TCDM_12466 [Trypanosoma cruzi Dm28c]